MCKSQSRCLYWMPQSTTNPHRVQIPASWPCLRRAFGGIRAFWKPQQSDLEVIVPADRISRWHHCYLHYNYRKGSIVAGLKRMQFRKTSFLSFEICLLSSVVCPDGSTFSSPTISLMVDNMQFVRSSIGRTQVVARWYLLSGKYVMCRSKWRLFLQDIDPIRNKMSPLNARVAIHSGLTWKHRHRKRKDFRFSRYSYFLILQH